MERWEQGTDDADVEKKRLEKEKQKKLKAARRLRDKEVNFTLEFRSICLMMTTSRWRVTIFMLLSISALR